LPGATSSITPGKVLLIIAAAINLKLKKFPNEWSCSFAAVAELPASVHAQAQEAEPLWF
jgi:hypothetical protein